MDIVVREIEEKDYPSVLSIGNRELGCTNSIEEVRDHYARIRDNECYKNFVAVLDGEVVGVISAVWAYGMGQEVGFLHIVALAVKAERQNRGIGTKLIEQIEDYAKEKGIGSIILNSKIQRTDAHAFYKRRGYDNRAWSFSKKL